MITLRTLEEHELRDARVEAEKSATKRENPEKAFRGNSGMANLVCGWTAEYI